MMKIHYKRFLRHKDQIYKQFKKLNGTDERMGCAQAICMHMNAKRYEYAYNVLTVESDKLRHSKYGDILRKYKIYIDFKKDRKRQKYERMCAFYDIGKYRERIRNNYLLGGI